MNRGRKDRRGITLVEMLVVVLLSTMAMAGLASALLTARGALNAVQEKAVAMSNLAIGLDYIGRYAELAGYRSYDFGLEFDQIGFCVPDSGCAGEFLSMTYQNTGEPNCAGVVSDAATVTARFAIRRSVAGDSFSLYCNDQEIVEHIAGVGIRVAVSDAIAGTRWIDDPAVLRSLEPERFMLLEAKLDAAAVRGIPARLVGLFRLMNLGAPS